MSIAELVSSGQLSSYAVVIMSSQTSEPPIKNQLCTVVNCSTVLSNHSDGPTSTAALAEVARLGWRKVEFWWPFASAEPREEEIDQFCDRITEQGLGLHALNLWGGDMDAGQRGILHESSLSDAHLNAVAAIAQRTDLQLSNTLLGRSGGTVSAAQLRRLEDVVKRLAEVGVKPLVEPLSGMDDYPIVNPWQAEDVAQRTGAGVLADFYHFAANGVDVDAWLRDVENGVVSLPDHVQIADYPGRGAPGTAAAPLGVWIRRLKDAGYVGEVAGEWLS